MLAPSSGRAKGSVLLLGEAARQAHVCARTQHHPRLCAQALPWHMGHTVRPLWDFLGAGPRPAQGWAGLALASAPRRSHRAPRGTARCSRACGFGRAASPRAWPPLSAWLGGRLLSSCLGLLTCEREVTPPARRGVCVSVRVRAGETPGRPAHSPTGGEDAGCESSRAHSR